MKKSALIIGITGQDGSILARRLLDEGFTVVGISTGNTSGYRLAALGIASKVTLIRMDAAIDRESLVGIFERRAPTHVFNLGGVTSVSYSYRNPEFTLHSISNIWLNLEAAIEHLDQPVRIFNAASSECFGIVDNGVATEYTVMKPISPYGSAKAQMVESSRDFRQKKNAFVVNGFLFNHESELRSPEFVIPKVVKAVRAISNGSRQPLVLGNVAIVRDWGWAYDFVDAIYKVTVDSDSPDDFIISTGKPVPLARMVEEAFQMVDLSSADWVEFDPRLVRVGEVESISGDPSHIKRQAGWVAEITGTKVIEKLMLS